MNDIFSVLRVVLSVCAPLIWHTWVSDWSDLSVCQIDLLFLCATDVVCRLPRCQMLGDHWRHPGQSGVVTPPLEGDPAALEADTEWADELHDDDSDADDSVRWQCGYWR